MPPINIADKKSRKNLSADALFQMVRSGFDAIPDARTNPTIPLGDVLMSAFAMFSLKDPSLLAFDQRRQDPSDNFRTIYGIENASSDTQMRASGNRRRCGFHLLLLATCSVSKSTATLTPGQAEWLAYPVVQRSKDTRQIFRIPTICCHLASTILD